MNNKRREILSLETRFEARIHIESCMDVLPSEIDLNFVRRGAEPVVETETVDTLDGTPA